MIAIDRKKAREGDGGFFEGTVQNRRAAQFLSTQLGILPMDFQALIHITDEDLWVHHGTLMTLGMIQIYEKVEADSDAPDDITLKPVEYLFSDGGKQRVPLEAV